MALLKRTYALPAETLEQFERAVAPGKRSPRIAAVLQEWLDRGRRAQLRREIVDGCREMADVYRQVEGEFHPLDEEVDRAIDARPPARGRRSRAARPRRRV